MKDRPGWTAHLAPGDKVFCVQATRTRDPTEYQKFTVERTTKAQVIVVSDMGAEYRFWNHTGDSKEGSEVGRRSSFGSYRLIYEINAENQAWLDQLSEKLAAERRLGEQRRALADAALACIDPDAILRAHTIINEANER